MLYENMDIVVDHIIIAVADLEQATQAFSSMLGRKPSWRGTHPTYGSANSLFRLDNTYLELLAATGGEGFAGARVRDHISTHGEGLLGLIFGTDNAEAFCVHAKEKGLAVSAPQEGTGIDDNTGAVRKWRNMFWDDEAANGIFSFMIAHDNPEALPIAPIEGVGHITGVDHIVVQSSDKDHAKKFFGDQLGVRLALEQSRPAWGGDMLFFRCNSMSVEVIAPHDPKKRRDALTGLALKTDDIAASVARLQAAGIKVSKIREGRKPKTLVATIKSHVCEVPTLLIQHQ